jgi:hypothetical protein
MARLRRILLHDSVANKQFCTKSITYDATTKDGLVVRRAIEACLSGEVGYREACARSSEGYA